MRKIQRIALLAGMGTILFLLSAFQNGIVKKEHSTFSLTVKVNTLRNNKGDVLFALYNKEGTIPDEKFKNYFRITTGKISGDSSEVVFRNLPAGRYAVSVLHDEDCNGKIKKGFFLPKEGVGFSNYKTINLSHRPSFKKASFELDKNTDVSVKIIYL